MVSRRPGIPVSPCPGVLAGEDSQKRRCGSRGRRSGARFRAAPPDFSWSSFRIAPGFAEFRQCGSKTRIGRVTPCRFMNAPHREVGRLVLRSSRTIISARNRLCRRGKPSCGGRRPSSVAQSVVRNPGSTPIGEEPAVAKGSSGVANGAFLRAAAARIFNGARLPGGFLALPIPILLRCGV